jgi:polyhydroxybutyrate depolymerase
MKNLFFFILLLVVFIQTSVAQTTVIDSMVSGGIMRYYHVYIPKNYVTGSSRPLIMYFHGYGSNASIEQAYSNFMPVADTAGFFIVYPEGLKDGNGNQYWNAGIPGIPTTPDDVAFVSSLIDALHLRYNINTSKVYATGLSNGGYMSYRLAWKLSDKIAAIASVSGSMSPADFAICTPPRPIPIMEIHGTADQTVSYTGSAIATDIDTLMRFWVHNDHCIPISDPLAVPDLDPNDGSNVIHFEWVPELQNMSVELYRITGGGHVDWPGAGTGNNMDFSASPTIWQFFNRFQLSSSGVKEKETGPYSFDFYPNPCSDIIHIPSNTNGIVTIFDLTGRKMLTSKEKNIDLIAVPSGFYFLEFEGDGIRSIEKLVKF